MNQQRRLFRCRKCGAEVYSNAPPVNEDDESEWPVCQGNLLVGGEESNVVDIHEPTTMIPPGGDT